MAVLREPRPEDGTIAPAEGYGYETGRMDMRLDSTRCLFRQARRCLRPMERTRVGMVVRHRSGIT